MKKIVLLFYLVIIAISTEAQVLPQSGVPSVVLNAFQQKFTNAADIEWETKGDLYKAEFKIGSRGHDVWIDKSGNITKHKEDFPKKDLPQSIQQKISTEFSAYKLDDADKIEEHGKVYYQVELDGSTDNRRVLFTADGTIEKNTVDKN